MAPTNYGVWGSVVSSSSGTKKRVLEYLELEKAHLIIYDIFAAFNHVHIHNYKT